MSQTRPVSLDLLEAIRKTSDFSLKKNLESQLWEQLKKDGLPIISNADGHYQLTFLYQSSVNNQIITLDSPDFYDKLLDANNQLKTFKREPYTDIYYCQINDVPKEFFASYKIKINQQSVLDPYANQSKVFEYDVNSNEINSTSLSYVNIPNTKPKPSWATLSSPLSEPHRTVICDNNFKKDTEHFAGRDIFIYKPDGFEDAKNKKVIFVLDGSYFCKIATPYIDVLRHDERYKNEFKDTAIIFVNSNPSYSGIYPIKAPDRVYEYYFMKDQFSSFIAKEVLPYYRKQWDIQSKNVILVGHSLGAYLVANTVLQYPDAVGGVMLFSAALNRCRPILVPGQNEQGKKIPIYMQIGLLEDDKPPDCIQGSEKEGQEYTNESIFEANRTLHKDLLRNHYLVSLETFSSGHDERHMISGIVQGLRFLQNPPLSPEKYHENTSSPKPK